MNRTSAIPHTVLLLFIRPDAAIAHLVTTGLGPYYDGAVHLLLSPNDLLGLLVVTMLAGLQGIRTARWAVITLPTAWLAAGLIGFYYYSSIDLPWMSVLSFMILGVLVAVNVKLPNVFVSVLAGLFGILHGLLNGSALAAIGSGPRMIIGSVLMVLVIGLLGSAFTVALKSAWARIAIRVVGSWVAAVGMLMLGWLMRKPG